MRMGLFAAILAGCASFLPANSVLAGETGLASALHQLGMERGRLCMSGHFHFGTGRSAKSKALAIRAAKRSWAKFVSLEYGSDWERFSLAGSKGVKCGRENGGFKCSVEARPCKVVSSRYTKRSRARKARHKGTGWRR